MGEARPFAAIVEDMERHLAEERDVRPGHLRLFAERLRLATFGLDPAEPIAPPPPPPFSPLMRMHRGHSNAGRKCGYRVVKGVTPWHE